MRGKGWEGPLATDDRADAVILVRREDDRVPALKPVFWLVRTGQGVFSRCRVHVNETKTSVPTTGGAALPTSSNDARE